MEIRNEEKNEYAQNLANVVEQVKTFRHKME